MIDWDGFNHVYIPALNASCGFHGVLFAMLEHYGAGESALLLSEPKEVLLLFEDRFPDTTFTITSYSGDLYKNFEFDLNVFTPSEIKYDAVFSQATLEHVCRPSIAIENMAERCCIGGHIVLHSVNPQCPLHRLPLDCVRFFRDFYYDLTKYIPIKIVAYSESGPHQFVVYEKLGS